MKGFFGGKLLTPVLFKADFKINLILWVLVKSLFLLLSSSWCSQVLFSQDRLWLRWEKLIPTVCPINWMDKKVKKKPRADGLVYGVQPDIQKPWNGQWGLYDKVHNWKHSELQFALICSFTWDRPWQVFLWDSIWAD